jgi:hypothetical protein
MAVESNTASPSATTSIWYATATSALTGTIVRVVTYTGFLSITTYAIVGAATAPIGVSSSGAGAATATETASLTPTRAGSWVITSVVADDLYAALPTRTATPAAAVVDLNVDDGGSLGAFYNFVTRTTATNTSALTLGTTSSASVAGWAVAALEILAPASQTTVTASASGFRRRGHN